MFNTPSKHNGSSAYSTPKRMPLRGLFADGIWHCNCNPRLPAAHFQVKKEGPNTNRWFYTCQEAKQSSCEFFLWDDAAKSRERGALMNNARSETDQFRTPPDTTRDKRTIEGHSAASNKWMADLGKADEDEFGDWTLSPGEEKRLAVAMDTPAPETPRKAVKKDQFATPSGKRKWQEDALPTPATTKPRADEDVFFTPASRLKSGMWDGNEHRGGSRTPTSARYRESTEASEGSIDRPLNNYDISEEVMDLLKDQNIDEETSASLKLLLNRHALKISGIAKGRDITRVALKSKDTKIAELQQKIFALETERELDKTIIRHFKSDMAHSVEKRSGKGRGKS